MMLSSKTILVCLILVFVAICDAKTIKKHKKTADKKPPLQTSTNNKDLWPFTATVTCDYVSSLDTDYNYSSKKGQVAALQSWPNCGLNRFSPRPGDIKLQRKLRSFQEYLSELQETIREARMSSSGNGNKNLTKDGRIVGGKPVASGRWPWLALIGQYAGTPFCGATVIADRWLVTAAHCFEDEVQPCAYSVRVGATEWLTDPEGLCQDSEVAGIYRHPGYDSSTHANDIALLKLKTPLMLDSDTNVNAICLPETGRSVPPGTILHAAGWGLQGEGKPTTISMEAREVTVPLIAYNGKQCGEYPDEMFLKGMLCAGYTTGGRDTCQGDSGGPLIYKMDDKWYQLGATSFGAGCAQKNFPGIYTDVGQFRDWMASCIARNS